MARTVVHLGAIKALEESPQIKQALLLAAGQAAEAAKQLAPVLTGAYRDSIRAVMDSEGVRVEAGDFKAKWIEFGDAYFPAHAPLRRGAENAGLQVHPGEDD